jgi:hypothetical protein
MSLDLLPPAVALISCQSERHRLRWEHGELQALDHDDVDGELALTALGGEPTRCAQIVANWRRAENDLRVLVLASRGAADLLNPPTPEQFQPAGPSTPGNPHLFASGHAASSSFGWYSYAPMGSASISIGGHGGAGPDEPTPDPLFALLQLPGGLPDRLVATVATSWTQRVAEGVAPSSATAALTVALVSRVRLALQGWLGENAAEMDVVMLAPGSSPTIERTDGRVRVGLPFSWLADVWVLGLTHVLGRFTLASHAAEDRVELDTVGTGLDHRPVTIAFGS